MPIQGNEIYESRPSHLPTNVVDVHGHNVVIYMEENIWRDHKTGALTPDLLVRPKFPDFKGDGSENENQLWGMVDIIANLIRRRVGEKANIVYSNAGLVIKPKAAEHDEASSEAAALVNAHPAFFESREALSEKVLRTVHALRTEIQTALDESRNDPSLLSSDPRPSTAAERAGQEALKGIIWHEEDEERKKGNDGYDRIYPRHYSGVVFAEQQPFGVSPEAFDHGLRTAFADLRLDVGIVNHVRLRDGHMWELYATPDSYAELQKILKESARK